jgi:hypothetical protein
MDEKQGTNKAAQCLPLFHFHPSLTLILSRFAVSVLPIDPLPLPLVPAHLSATPTTLTIVPVTGTHAVPRTGEGEGGTIIVAVADVMTPAGIMNLIRGTGETMTGATVLATTTMVATRAAIFVTAAATMKKGITTVDATNVITMTATVDAIAHRVDVPEVGGGMSDHGHPVVVQVGCLRPRARAIR